MNTDKSKITLAILLCFTLLLFIPTILFSWSATRRSADELVKIESAKFDEQMACKRFGGTPQYDDANNWRGCKY